MIIIQDTTELRRKLYQGEDKSQQYFKHYNYIFQIHHTTPVRREFYKTRTCQSYTKKGLKGTIENIKEEKSLTLQSYTFNLLQIAYNMKIHRHTI